MTDREGTSKKCGAAGPGGLASCAVGLPKETGIMRTSIRTGGIVLGMLLSVLPLRAGAQATDSPPSVTIRGRVTDSESRAAVDLAEVVIVGASRPAYTDEHGRFLLEGIRPGTYKLSITRLGFAPLRRELIVVAGADQSLELKLIRDAVPLEEITVRMKVIKM